MNKSKTAITVSRIIELVQIILGGAVAVFFILLAIYSMLDDVEDGVGFIITLWVLGLLGLWAFLAGMKQKKLRLEFKKYAAYLSVDPTGSLDGIASASGVSVETVKKNLNAMIRKNYFTNAYIDHANNRLVILPEAANVGAAGEDL